MVKKQKKNNPKPRINQEKSLLPVMSALRGRGHRVYYSFFSIILIIIKDKICVLNITIASVFQCPRLIQMAPSSLSAKRTRKLCLICQPFLKLTQGSFALPENQGLSLMLLYNRLWPLQISHFGPEFFQDCCGLPDCLDQALMLF